MIIGVDFDDVVADSAPIFFGFCNRYYGTDFQKKEFTDPDFYKLWKVSREEMLARWKEFDWAATQEDIPPLPGAQEMVVRLAAKHELHIITNRPADLNQSTIRWIDKHFPEVFAKTHFCTKKGEFKTFRTKSSVCKNIRANIILEDHPHNARICATDGIHVYLFDQPWNRQEMPLLAGAVIRVSSWQDRILETLLR